MDKALSRLQSAVDKLVKKSGDSGKTDGKDDGTQKPAAKPGSALSNTGASVFGVGITAVILLAAAGAALVAVISGVCAARHPAAAAHTYRAAFGL